MLILRTWWQTKIFFFYFSSKFLKFIKNPFKLYFDSRRLFSQLQKDRRKSKYWKLQKNFLYELFIICGVDDVRNSPDARAQIGFMSGEGRSYLLPISGRDQVSFKYMHKI